MIRIVFLDFDGTVYSHKTNCVPASAVRALWRLKELGVLVYTCTGRSWSELEMFSIRDYPFDGHICLTGQLCLDHEGNMVFCDQLQERDLNELIRIFNEKQIGVMLFDQDSFYPNYINETMARIHQNNHTPIPAPRAYDGRKIIQFSLYGNWPEIQETLTRFDPALGVYSWNDCAVDVTASQGGKGEGIGKLLDKLGIDRNEALAIGDGDNDLEMLKAAGVSVAMGNATEMIKGQADYITDDIDEDGLWNALAHYGIL